MRPREPQGSNVTDSDSPHTDDIGKFDPGLTQRMIGVMRPVLKTYFRSEVHGLDSFPPGGALVVGNHSGGMFPMDVPIFSVDFYDKFGYDRPVYTLSHDVLFMGVTGPFFGRTGYIRANRENADKALRSGGVVVVFPGGDYDAYRSTLSENVIDFNGRKGYVSTAIEAGVPIVPAVSIGRTGDPALSVARHLAGPTAGTEALAARRHPAAVVRHSVRVDRRDPTQPAAAHQDRHASA